MTQGEWGFLLVLVALSSGILSHGLTRYYLERRLRAILLLDTEEMAYLRGGERRPSQ